MKRQALLVLLIVGGVASSVAVFAEQKPQNAEDEAIKAVVTHSWFITGEQDFRRVVSIPYLGMSVRGKGNKTTTFRDQADIDKYLKALREQDEKLAKEPPTGGGPIPIIRPEPQLSQLIITRPNANVAYVAYNFVFKPNPGKLPPMPLLAVLRKEQNAWKLVFNTMP